jgi:hypothetical protein
MTRKAPRLGIAINACALVGAPLMLFGVLWGPLLAIGAAIAMPAIILPQTSWWRDYWREYE